MFSKRFTQKSSEQFGSPSTHYEMLSDSLRQSIVEAKTGCLFNANNVQVRDAGSMEPPVTRDDLKHEAIQDEFEFLIRDPETIQAAFGEGFRVDAIACALFAEIADTRKPSMYEAVAKRIEHALRDAIWHMATENVEGRE